MDDCRIINLTSTYVEISLCEENVKLTKRNIAFDLTDQSALNSFLAELDLSISLGKPLNRFGHDINVRNLLRILTVAYFDATIVNWKSYFRNLAEMGQPTFKAAFSAYFGARYIRSKEEDNRLYDSIRDFALDYISTQKHRDIAYAASDAFTVERISVDNNVCEYKINGEAVITICLSKRKEFCRAETMLATLNAISSAARKRDYTELLSIIRNVGKKAFLSISEHLFRADVTECVMAYAKHKVESNRKMLFPRSIMEEFFGCGYYTDDSDYFANILGKLERQIPEMDDYLIAHNDDEIYSDKTEWLIYEPSANRALKCRIYFDGPKQYVEEVQAYCRKVIITCRVSNQPFSYSVQRIARSANIAHRALKTIGFEFYSTAELKTYHIKALQAQLTEKEGYDVATQREVLLNLKAIHINAASCQNKISHTRFMLPKQPLKPISPVSSDVLNRIPSMLSSAPLAIQIAYGLIIATGARADSICKLTTDDLINVDGKNAVVIHLLKTLGRTEVATRKVALEESFALHIQKFISETKDLRSQLKIPYLLVYASNRYRENSCREPRVLNPDALKDAAYKYFRELNVYTSDGFPNTCTPRVLRATFGHELYLEGISLEEASKRMGNSPKTKGDHYTTLSAKEEAVLRNKLYEQTIVPLLSNGAMDTKQLTPVMYGDCNRPEPCNKNNCMECNQLIVCKQKKG